MSKKTFAKCIEYIDFLKLPREPAIKNYDAYKYKLLIVIARNEIKN